MRLYLDSADRALIQRAYATGYAAGVTTNPTLLRRAGLHRADLPAFVRAAGEAGAGEIHLQVLAHTVDAMVTDGEWLQALDPPRVLVKVPASSEGLAAGARLAARGVGVTVTATYAVRQVVLAESIGARYVATYLGRMRDAGLNALAVIERMLAVMRIQQMRARLLVASVRAPEDVEALASVGAPCATLPPELFFALPHVAETAEAVRAFQQDTEGL
jgi:transaldolase